MRRRKRRSGRGLAIGTSARGTVGTDKEVGGRAGRGRRRARSDRRRGEDEESARRE